MDYTKLLQELQQASMFDLFRLKASILIMLEQPNRIKEIQRRLRPGQEISYFTIDENRLVPAIVEDIHRVYLYVRNKDDGKRWKIRYYMVNMEGVDADIHASHSRLERNHLKVGETVGYRDRMQREQYGQIIRLNPKTATIRLKTGHEWRVPYSLLFKVMDGEGNPTAEPGLIEGEVL